MLLLAVSQTEARRRKLIVVEVAPLERRRPDKGAEVKRARERESERERERIKITGDC